MAPKKLEPRSVVQEREAAERHRQAQFENFSGTIAACEVGISRLTPRIERAHSDLAELATIMAHIKNVSADIPGKHSALLGPMLEMHVSHAIESVNLSVARDVRDLKNCEALLASTREALAALEAEHAQAEVV